MSKNANIIPANTATENIKPYTLRGIQAEDFFPIVNILRKIGFNEIKSCLSDEAIHKIINDVLDMITHRAFPKAKADGEGANDKMIALGLSVLPTAFDVVDIVLGNISKCENDIYKLLASLSSLSVNEIKKLSLVDFADMILDVVMKDDFRDFIKVVSKRFK